MVNRVREGTNVFDELLIRRGVEVGRRDGFEDGGFKGVGLCDAADEFDAFEEDLVRGRKNG
jgi:hypothetical protein